jgi:hypothetical protein
MGGTYATKRETRNPYKILVVKPQENRPLVITTRGWCYIKMVIRKAGCGLNSTLVAYDNGGLF